MKCGWFLEKNLSDVVTIIFLGASKDATLYPTHEMMIKAILASFNVCNDAFVYYTFRKEWNKPNSLQRIVMKYLCDCLGSITCRARTELYK